MWSQADPRSVPQAGNQEAAALEPVTHLYLLGGGQVTTEMREGGGEGRGGASLVLLVPIQQPDQTRTSEDTPRDTPSSLMTEGLGARRFLSPCPPVLLSPCPQKLW